MSFIIIYTKHVLLDLIDYVFIILYAFMRLIFYFKICW
jgi:hypothetical protein